MERIDKYLMFLFDKVRYLLMLTSSDFDWCILLRKMDCTYAIYIY
jgi:hypothetical protein